ncbi:Glu/Leu/Phe/Val dehydrogenase [Anaerococcus sp. AGMB09787]|uniref:Glu/Leu/Phe/Val family dehydrogenase n=1 Tax=Anaerococcus sp. AGMB09787 TaxID=2922869 RepID=UPI001FAF5A1E|nr:Glu/Leu/Phe/Val dehydrogenase [Anaerococcus sp. AGMB09787]
MSQKLNILENVRSSYKDACDLLGLDQAVYEILKDPERIIEVSIPIKMDDGSSKVFKAYRSAHSSALGPSKGGVRFDKNVNADEVKALSMMMSIKTALLDLPLGGGKGGITVDPKKLSERELESLSRGYVRAINNYLGSRIDVPAPDVNTNGKIMGYFVDEYMQLNASKQDIATFTGKPLELGGSLGRDQATGYGVALAVKYAYKRKGDNLLNKTFAIQGFGNVGYFTAKYLCEFGAKLLAVNASDSSAKSGSSAIYCEDGFDPDELKDIRREKATVLAYDKATKISNEEFFALDVDIIVPAAMENVITEEIAKTVKAKVIAEGANGPTTLKAANYLEGKDILIIPDILANSGGVLVSHYEWIQNQIGYYLSYEMIKKKEKEDMLKVFEQVFDFAENNKVNLRKASFMKAVAKIAQALKYRGRY